MRERWRGPGSFRWQITLSAAVLSTFVAVLLVVVVSVGLARSTNSAVSKVLSSRSDAFIDAVQADTTGSSLSVPSAQLEPGVAVFDDSGLLVAGDVPESQARFYRELSTVSSRTTKRLGDAFELRAEPFSTPAGAAGVLVLSERLDAFQNNQHAAEAVAIAAGALIIVAATGLASWAGKRALVPVADMARTAENWSDADLERRFNLGPATNEIRALGHTLDGLLDRVQQAILAEQRLTSELAHEMRTPLTTVRGTAELLSMRDDLDEQLRADVGQILTACTSMSDTIAGLLNLARVGNASRITASSDLSNVLRSVVQKAAGGDRVVVRPHQEAQLALPAELAVRAIVPVVENATQLAAQVRVTATLEAGRARIEVADDGPGVAPDLAVQIFTPGVSGRDGNGLGLALAQRIARTAGGDIELIGGSDLGGAAFAITLPRRETA